MGVVMTAPITERYIDRKPHECGCVTVWDVHGGGPRFSVACGVHRGYAQRFPAELQAQEGI